MIINTVGELRKALEICDDEEHLSFEFKQPRVMAPDKKLDIKVKGVYGWGGGRCVTVVFEPSER
ncbi:MAG: hypothetical protein ACW99G_19240 [Candidatus Thorarchaeota archaeon]|jgi:hypothetical protein